ncbi:MAG: hypothetical protein M5U34_07555 [Chloroflexi bacterium]|nr:hypothetical protein [Chloroflexota bacterium]
MFPVVPKGTALGLSDLASAMFSGYFIESSGAVRQQLKHFCSGKSKMWKKKARTRRGTKSIDLWQLQFERIDE